MAHPTPIDPALRIGSVHLAVTDLPRSIDFYERILGLPLIARDQQRALLGLDVDDPALTLRAIERATALSPHSTGLFHVAWLHPSRAALAATVQRIARGGWPIDGASDHGVSEALYLGDPDGLGIEVYADRPPDRWPRAADGRGVEMVTRALDLDDLMAQAPAESEAEIAEGTGVGHVHLKVADVPRAVSFYRDSLGFDEQARLPAAAFLSAGGYHHHVGLNSWQSRGADPSPPSAPGLRLVEFRLGDDQALAALEQRLADTDDAPPSARPHGQPLTVRDPDGQQLAFTAAGGA